MHGRALFLGTPRLAQDRLVAMARPHPIAHPIRAAIALLAGVALLALAAWAVSATLSVTVALASTAAAVAMAVRVRIVERARAVEVRRELASIAHDLKGPLSTIASYLDMIVQGTLGPVSEETRIAAPRAALASMRAHSVVESVLLRHVQSAATRPVPVETVDLRSVIRDVTEALHAEIAASQAEVTVEPLLRVVADHAQLFRVFENLVQNAVKYARPGEAPVVTITGSCDADRAEIAVRDHGIGIPSADCERVFEIAARAVNGQSVAFGHGHGHGLATVRRLVRDLGGEVWVDTTSLDGATVRLSLPLAK
ncbi:MAG: sensor histidine kinase [Chloroflexi bacterium]|nr:MAG: sensor histidine kinase [Chloroflexota bacterium]